MKVYQYDAAGYYVGPTEDYGGPMPHNCTSTAPAITDGHIPRWNGAAWQQVQDHKGKQGYLNGDPCTIAEYGPLPEGWSDDPPPPTEAELREERIEKIQAELDEIDRQSVRPLRAMAKGAATAKDTDKLAALDTRAAELRIELQGLEGEAE